ncbi:helix-turn-helix domain-containing protein [Paenibacillus roseipurpureus]|uniref:Helix-turn-helix domain-containing protein n=1 Tax=Paenibacillus roseopurpureus TaxID=2918901 RepID=A0AA96LQT4_9BACL|nr:helix-turn-helix domain-containing protein [Paenibacillus sp. MBLB1832]WNR45631.1 helix-turn-helix domain-containing protein [Paenibacillus sp. MBLB1832]
MLKFIHLRELYMRIFLLVAVLFLGLAGAYSTFLTKQISNYAIQEVDAVTIVKLGRFKTNLEQTIQRLKLSGLLLYQERNIGYWLNGISQDSYLDHAADSVLTDYIATERLVQDVYLFNFSTRSVLSARSGRIPFETFPDQEFLQALKGQSKVAVTINKQWMNGRDELVYTLPNDAVNQTSHGIMFIVLNRKQLSDELLLSNNEFESKLLIVDRDQSILLGGDPSSFLDDFRKWLSGDYPDRGQWKAGGEEWGIQSAEIEMEGWKLYLLSPQSVWKSKLFALNLRVLSYFFLMVLLLLVVLYWLSKRNFKPFTELLQKIGRYNGNLTKDTDKSSWRPPGHDFMMIHSGIDHLVNRVEEQARNIKESSPIVKDALLRQWLLSDFIGPSMRNDLTRTVKLMLDEPFWLAVLRIENYSAFCEKYDFSSRKLMKFALSNIVEEVVSSSGFLVEVSDLGGDHIVLILGESQESPDKNHQEAYFAVLEEAREQAIRWIGLESSIGLSGPLIPLENMYEAYGRTVELSKLSFLTGVSQVYTEDLKSELSAHPYGELDPEQTFELIQALRMRDKDSVHRLLEKLFNRLQNLPVEECHLQLIQLLYTLSKSFKPIVTSDGMVGIKRELEQFNSLMDLQQWLERLLLGGIEQAEARGKQKEDIFAEVLEYIGNQLHNAMLTVEDIAEHISLSPNHLRLIFKERFLISISDYILECRIHKVKELLVQTNWSITEICSQSGFQSKSHFFTAFKKATGLTPSQYREREGTS